MQQHKIDPTQWALPEAETLAVVPGKVQRRRRHFIKVPWSWVDRLAGARHIATYRVAFQLLYQHWRQGDRPILLANGMLRREGVAPGTKWRALRELEQLGLITIERRPCKSPLVTVIV